MLHGALSQGEMDVAIVRSQKAEQSIVASLLSASSTPCSSGSSNSTNWREPVLM